MRVCGQRDENDPSHALYLLCGHTASGLGMAGLSEEGRGLSFPLIGGLVLEGMTKE